MTTVDPLRELLDKAAEGDDRAMAELVRRTQADLWRMCAALGSPGEEADLVQDTYLRAMRSLGSFRGDAQVRSWLRAVCRNVCADHVRRRVRDRRLVDRLTAQRVELFRTDAPALHDELDVLDPERREAFVLTQVLDLSYEDAAELVGCPVGTIRSRVFRARRDLVASLSTDSAASGDTALSG